MLKEIPGAYGPREVAAQRQNDPENIRTLASIGGHMEKFEPHLAGSWNAVLGELLLGVSHHISNRVSTLAGVSDILSQDSGVPPILRALADEVPKLEEAIRLLRLLAAPEEEEEPVEPMRLVEDAMSLARLHPELRGVSYKVEREEVPPVLARPSELTHRIVVALVGAGSGEIPVRVVVDGDDVVINVGDQAVRARSLLAARSHASKSLIRS